MAAAIRTLDGSVRGSAEHVARLWPSVERYVARHGLAVSTRCLQALIDDLYRIGGTAACRLLELLSDALGGPAYVLPMDAEE